MAGNLQREDHTVGFAWRTFLVRLQRISPTLAEAVSIMPLRNDGRTGFGTAAPTAAEGRRLAPRWIKEELDAFIKGES